MPYLFICLFVLLFVSRSFVVQNLILHFSGTLIDNYYSSHYLNTPFHQREIIFHCLFQFYILDVLRGNCTVIVVFEWKRPSETVAKLHLSQCELGTQCQDSVVKEGWEDDMCLRKQAVRALLTADVSGGQWSGHKNTASIFRDVDFQSLKNPGDGHSPNSTE